VHREVHAEPAATGGVLDGGDEPVDVGGSELIGVDEIVGEAPHREAAGRSG
jgi:hypothetical protein